MYTETETPRTITRKQIFEDFRSIAAMQRGINIQVDADTVLRDLLPDYTQLLNAVGILYQRYGINRARPRLTTGVKLGDLADLMLGL